MLTNPEGIMTSWAVMLLVLDQGPQGIAERRDCPDIENAHAGCHPEMQQVNPANGDAAGDNAQGEVACVPGTVL